MNVGDKVVMHLEGTVIEVSEFTTTIECTNGDTWSIDNDDPDWKVVTS